MRTPSSCSPPFHAVLYVGRPTRANSVQALWAQIPIRTVRIGRQPYRTCARYSKEKADGFHHHLIALKSATREFLDHFRRVRSFSRPLPFCALPPVSLLPKTRLLNPLFHFSSLSSSQKFLKMMDENQSIVLEGATGSGKTTQIPQWAIEKRGGKLVACTQSVPSAIL